MMRSLKVRKPFRFQYRFQHCEGVIRAVPGFSHGMCAMSVWCLFSASHPVHGLCRFAEGRGCYKRTEDER